MTNLRGGESYHNYGLAFDVVEYVDGEPDWNADWQSIGALGKAFGFEWGGDWRGKNRDRPHFQNTGGKSIDELKADRLNQKLQNQ